MSTPTTSTEMTFGSTSNMAPSSSSTYTGDAESSKMADTPLPQPTIHALNLTDYIFNVGFMQQSFADVQLTFFSDALKLHRIILARSPFLAGYMMNASPGTTIHLKFRDETITSESVYICIHHLYHPAFHLINPYNSRAVLVTSLLFGGMPEIAHQAYTVSRDGISAETLPEWIAWIGSTSMSDEQNGQTSAQLAEEAWEEGRYGRYGEYSSRLRQDIIDYLTLTLGPSPSSLLPLLPILPYPLFKQTLESPQLIFPNKQDRFAFSKKAINARKKLSIVPQGMEEAAVLAMREGGMEVEITRKGRKGRALWKVEG